MPFSFVAAALFAGSTMAAAYTPTSRVDTIMLTKTNIEASDYLSVDPTDKWATGKNYGASFGVATEAYFNMSSGRTLTATISGVESLSVFVYNSTQGRQYSVTVGMGDAQTITHGGTSLETSGVIATNNYGEVTVKVAGLDKSVYPVAIVVNKAPEKDDATLKSITVNSEEVEKFDPATTAYDVELPYGTTDIPVVEATATSSKATVSITQAVAVDGYRNYRGNRGGRRDYQNLYRFVLRSRVTKHGCHFGKHQH